jgi:nucleoside-diphosphate-sugar epimerase
MEWSHPLVVTGAAGYIGSVVSTALIEAGHGVVGVDSLAHGARPISNLLTSPRFAFRRMDLADHGAVRDLIAALRPRCVAHFAAIVGDPACRAQPDLARQVNLEVTKNLFDVCSEAGVERFVFASTCSNYGRARDEALLSEDSPLRPLSLYAETKVKAEEWIESRSGACQGIVLRFATAHGLSPRMRFDLTVNQFVRTILEEQKVELYDARTWRPYCHVLDFARIVKASLETTAFSERFHVLNVGSDVENYTKEDIVRKIADATSMSADVIDLGDGPDPRNYRVSFERLRRTLNIEPHYDVAFTARQIAAAIQVRLFESHPGDLRYGNQ